MAGTMSADKMAENISGEDAAQLLGTSPADGATIDPAAHLSAETTVPTPTDTRTAPAQSATDQDSKTVSNTTAETVMTNLLSEIDGAYQQLETRFSKLWLIASSTASDASHKLNLDAQKRDLQSQLEGLRAGLSSVSAAGMALSPAAVREQLAEIEKKVPAVAAVQEQASSALDKLDQKLETVERAATRYVSGFASFFSSIVSVEPAADSDSLARVSTDLSNSVAADSSATSAFGYGPGRHQTELYKLHTDPRLYTGVEDFVSEITVSDKTLEIASLLKKYPELQKLMRTLVPETVDYNSFWERYFYKFDQLTKQEEKRLALLQDSSKDENFTWDDDDDNEPITESSASPPATESVPPAAKESASTPDLAKKEESDDDWE